MGYSLWGRRESDMTEYHIHTHYKLWFRNVICFPRRLVGI